MWPWVHISFWYAFSGNIDSIAIARALPGTLGVFYFPQTVTSRYNNLCKSIYYHKLRRSFKKICLSGLFKRKIVNFGKI